MQPEFWPPQTRYSQSFLFLCDDEIWKAIARFPGYEVSNFGRVRNTKTDAILTGSIARTGYVHVSFQSICGQKACQVHVLVAKTFLPPPEPDQEVVNHINSIKTDNRLVNLEWVTRTDNAIHYHKTKKARAELNGYQPQPNGHATNGKCVKPKLMPVWNRDCSMAPSHWNWDPHTLARGAGGWSCGDGLAQ